MDIEILYQCPKENFIHCYFTTINHAIIAESPIDQPTNVKLHYISESNPEKSTTIRENLLTSIHNDLGPRTHIIRNIEVTKLGDIHIILNTTDGIQVIPFLNDRKKLTEDSKWYLPNINDSITAIHVFSETEEKIDIALGTVLANLYCLRYNILTQTFALLKDLKKWETIAQDSINCITGYNGETNEIVLGSYDNSIYAIIDKKLENQHITCDIGIYQESEMALTVTWVDYIRIKKYSSSFLRFYLVSVSNFGCLLYMRTIRGQWEMVQQFKIEIDSENNSAPGIDCIIRETSNPEVLTILSGSSNGKLYYWNYNLSTNTTLENRILDLQDGGLIHDITTTDNIRYHFLSDNDNCINSLYI